MFSMFNSLLKRESIRSCHLGQSIRPNGQNANMFTRNRFFHSKTNVRPSISSKAMEYPKGTSLFWAYMNAPGNMLFLTTNFLSLGILVTYRCLNTIANSDRISQNEIDTYAHMYLKNDLMKLDYSGDRFDLLKQHLKSKEVPVEEDVQDPIYEVEELIDEKNTTTESQYNNPAEEEDILPLTDTELDAYGSPMTRNIEKERLQQLFINQLLSVHQMRNLVSQIFHSEGTDMTLLNELSTETQADLINVLYDIITQSIPESDLKIESFEDLSSYLPAKYVSNALRTSHIPYLKNELLRFNDEYLKDEDLENIDNSNLEFLTKDAVESLMQKHSHNSEDLYLDLALLLMRSKIPQTANLNDIFSSLLLSSEEGSQERDINIKKNLSILMSSIFKNTQIEKVSTKYEDILESSIAVKDKAALLKALKDLNIDYLSLLHNNRNRSKFAINVAKSSRGHKKLAHETSIDVKLYTTAIQGLIDLNFDTAHIRKAINKVLKGLYISGGKGKVLFCNDQKPKDEASISKAMRRVPYKLVEQALWLSQKTQDSSLLSWCFKITQASEGYTIKTQQKLFGKMKEIAQSIGDIETLHRIEEVHN